MSTEKQKSGQQESSYERPPTVIENRLPDAVTEAAKDKEHEKKHRNVQSFFNLLLVLFTGATAAVGVWQGILTRQSIENAGRQAKAAEDANRLAREIAKANQTESKAAREETQRQSQAALDASIKMSRNDQRAWIGFDSMTATFAANTPLKLLVYVINTGRTPALDVKGGVNFELVNAGQKPRMKLDAAYVTPNHTVIFPNAKGLFTINWQRMGNITETQIQAVRNKVIVAYVHGRIAYQDSLANVIGSASA